MVNTASVAGVGVDTRHWIGGRRAGSAAAFTDVSPIDEQPVAEIARGTSAEVSAAVQAAREAFGGWSSTSPELRSRALNAIADGIERRAEELAQVETRDNGALLRSHRRSVMPRAAHNFRFFADWLGRLDAGDLEINGHREQVSWAPSGVTAVITPWNAPLMLATWRIAPALAAGNPVVAKPPEWAPLTASLLADITSEAGLPDGVFNLVQGLGTEAGAALAAHPRIARLAFTGSAVTGRLVAAAAGAQLTPVSIARQGGPQGTWITAIDDPYLPVHYPTVNLWSYLGRGLGKRWITISSTAQTGDTEDFLRAGRAKGSPRGRH